MKSKKLFVGRRKLEGSLVGLQTGDDVDCLYAWDFTRATFTSI